MESELNTLTYNNAEVTFTGATNNTATSDELEASALYQDKMGTAYSKSKMVLRAFNFAGISLILTAAAIKTGNLISNAYVLNPPSINNATYHVENNVFSFKFSVDNPGKYQVTYHLTVNGKEVLNIDCSEPATYEDSYSGLKIGDKGKFYIDFTNRVDYRKTIANYTYIVEE